MLKFGAFSLYITYSIWLYNVIVGLRFKMEYVEYVSLNATFCVSDFESTRRSHWMGQLVTVRASC